jgi:hypothetical protein
VQIAQAIDLGLEIPVILCKESKLLSSSACTFLHILLLPPSQDQMSALGVLRNIKPFFLQQPAVAVTFLTSCLTSGSLALLSSLCTSAAVRFAWNIKIGKIPTANLISMLVDTKCCVFRTVSEDRMNSLDKVQYIHCYLIIRCCLIYVLLL